MTQWGPNNPNPLSQMKTELVWEGKYDEYGNRRQVDTAGCSMPMQKIETIDEPRSQAAAKGKQDLLAFEKETTRLDDFRNMLIWGDNKLVMASLLKQFKGKIDLIYIDPPFDVGADFTMKVPLGDENETIFKDQSILEMVAYKDTWGKGTDSYLHMMYERLAIMYEFLSDTGCMYVHCDWRVNYFLRAILNEIFGREKLVNEIIWHYRTFQGQAHRYFARKHDTLLLFRKGREFTYNEQFDTAFEDTIDSKRWADYINKNKQITGDNMPIQDSRFLRYLRKWVAKHGREPGHDDVVYEVKGQPIDSVWDMKGLDPKSMEKVDYATQKPENLLERILLAGTNESDLVADFFCGSGTTGTVAERLNRRWIMGDLGRFAIHTSRKRLIDIQRALSDEGKPYRSFDVYNLGRYERQWWQKEKLKGANEEHRKVVLEFFKAEILENTPSPLIHGRKAGAYCHVDGIDSIFTRDEAKAVAEAVEQAGGKSCYCLAWEFEMDLRLTTAALEKELGIKLMLIQIPREIMEKNRKSPPPFLEMAVLEAEPVYRKKGRDTTIDIKITKFMPSLAEVPTKELEALRERAINSGVDFIDFWAVDFNWQTEKPFNHHWQDYRTRKDRSLKTVSDAGFRYEKSGIYTACVKVIDTFGCDTSITVEVKV